MKIYKQFLALFDPLLTPQNAQDKGYKYIDDVIYDHMNPSEAIIDIFASSEEFRCKLGKPTYLTIHDNYFGLYLPTKEPV